ncbi:MAG: XdhC family protein [Deltaproteobacteria bacterium]|nr:XdhC family protein [Deltaproteobacteria bacterium]
MTDKEQGKAANAAEQGVETLDVFRAVVRYLEEGRAVALCTVEETSGSAPREAGAKMAVPDGGRSVGTVGGGVLEARINDRARACLGAGRGETAELVLDESAEGGLPAQCGGTVRVRIEVLGAPRRVVIFGAGHVGAATARVARDAGFLPLVLDDRDDLLAPLAAEGLAVQAAGAERAVQAAVLRKEDCVVVVTRGHAHDERIVGDALRGPATAYVGMIGSRRKVAAAREALARGGVAAERLAALRAPIGLDIGAETPGELAVCIVGEIIRVLRKA